MEPARTPDNDENMERTLEEWRENLAEALVEIGRTYMPFGKFGPEKFPPHGVPLYDLPPEYLLWFRDKGFPKGKLGRLMEVVCDLRINGADEVLEPLRRAAGGRHSLRQEKRIAWDFTRRELPLKEGGK